MITYEQIENNYIEDSPGLWVLTFRVSDTQAGIFADSITTAVFTGSGLDDMTSGGTYTGVAALDIVVEITDTATDKFRWSIDGGSTWQGLIKTITGASQELVNGVTVTFTAALGHTIGDIWAFSVMGTANIFEIEDVKKDIDLKTGKLAEDEMSFSISQTQLLNEENRLVYADALSFIQDAQTIGTLRYTGLFLHRTGATLDQDVLAFAGVVLPEQNWEDINVNDSEWAEVLDAVRDWEITCRPFFEDVFDDVLMKATFDEDDNLIKDGIITRMEQEWNGSAWVNDTTWRDANVANRQGHWYKSASEYSTFVDLVNLNKLLKRFTNLAKQIIINDGKGTYTIGFDKETIDGIFRPTRYNRTTTPNGYIHWYVGNWLGNYMTTGFTFPTNEPFIDGGIGELKLGIYEDESGGDETDNVSPFVSYRNVKVPTSSNKYIEESNVKSAEELGWDNHEKIKSFTDFLYYLAVNFGMFLEIYFSSTTNIQIKFVSRESFGEGSQVYIKDYTAGGGKVFPEEIKKEDIFYGLSWYRALEGKDYYLHTPLAKDDWMTSEEFDAFKKEGRRLLLTVSPTLCVSGKNISAPILFAMIPHNMNVVFPNSGFQLNDWSFIASQSLHTGIYMKVDPIDAGVDREPGSAYFTTAGYWVVNSIDYDKMADYLNDLNGLEESYYEKELNLECPFLCNFSQVANPTDYDDLTHFNWKNLVLGSKFDYNSKTYVVTSITRNFRQKTTSIKLQNNDRFTFSNSATLSTKIQTNLVQNKVVNPLSRIKTATGNIAQYNIVTLNDDGTVSESRSFGSHYKKLYGIATENIIDGNEGEILISGATIISEDWSIIEGQTSLTGTPKQKIYLDKDDTIGVSIGNLTTTPILEKTGVPPNVKNLNACIGVFITDDTLLINFDEQWVIE